MQSNFILFVYMNSLLEPFDDVRVRQAINILMPRDAVAESPTDAPTADGRPLLQAEAAFPPDTYLRVSDQHIIRRGDGD